ncbi:hypothetical protein CBR59_07175 [Bacillus thuringiensis]|nr:hypothetical protein CBP87_15180 [Bacillus thuringiensis]PNK58081.1 hypothetical protein CBR59_07175 [Bacillus thuringiensis]
MVMDFEKQAMQARLDLAERQINERLKVIGSCFDRNLGSGDLKAEEVNLYMILSTITGKPNKYIEF